MEQQIPQVPPLTDLITALEHATLIVKQLPTTTDPSQLLQLCSSLQTANNQFTSFLTLLPSSQPQAGENSVSSAVGGDEQEPMQIGDEEEATQEENSSKIIIEKVEERLRNFNIHNKRSRKRPLSPTSAAVEQRDFYGGGNDVLVHGFDPYGTRLRSLDLVFQFHG